VEPREEEEEEEEEEAFNKLNIFTTCVSACCHVGCESNSSEFTCIVSLIVIKLQ